MRQRVLWIVGLCLTASYAAAQSWMAAYEEGLEKGRKGDWVGARAAFKQAIAYRTEDYSKPTNLPGPATERRVWRKGAAYSPNFLAAVAAIKAAGSAADDNAKNALLASAAAELETLIAKNQYSYEAFYFLNSIYVMQADAPKRMRLEEQFSKAAGQLTWRVDTELLTPEDAAAVAQMAGRDIEQPIGAPPDPIVATPNTSNPPILSAGGTRVTVLETKFALIIGNTETKLPSLGVASAADDAQLLRESLMANAGYGERNIDLVINATRDQILASARALADRVPEGATVFIFFSGVGANLDGKDFLAGVDTESITDSSTMAAKMDVYRPFLAKNAHIFSFFQVNRTIANGRYFGMEVPLAGNIAQMQATIPGDTIFTFPKSGRERGIFADALAGTIAEFRTNRIPIQEFGWQVFYRIRRGGVGSSGGGSRQTPTLPVLTQMGATASF